MPQIRPVAVLGGVRIPFCRQNTAYADVGNLGMSVRTLGALVERFGLHGQQLGEVAMGAVIKHSADWNLGREAAMSSGLSPLTPGITLQRACGTSLDSIMTIANKIAVGQIQAGIGGGSDTTSDVPIVYGQKLRRRLLRAAGAKTTKDKLGALDRKSTRLNSSHVRISYAVFCLKKKKTNITQHLPKNITSLQNNQPKETNNTHALITHIINNPSNQTVI